MAATVDQELQASRLAYNELGNLPVGQLDRLVCDAAQQKLAEHKTKDALDGVAHPASILTQAQVTEAYKKPYKKDQVKANSNPPELVHSTGTGSQAEVIQRGEQHVKALYDLKANGYGKMKDGQLKAYLKDNLAENLAADPAYLEVKKLELPADTFKPPKYPGEWRKYCVKQAEEMLRNPAVAERIIQSGVDACNLPADIDYKGLQTLLVEVYTMEGDITTLASKIGEPAVLGQNAKPATGMYHEIDTMRTAFHDAYKVVVDHTKTPPNNIDRGTEADLIYKTEDLLRKRENVKKKCNNLVRDFSSKDRWKTYKVNNGSKDVFSFQDPETNAVIERDPPEAVTAGDIVTEYEQKAIEVEAEIQAYKADIKRMKDAEEAAKKAIKDKEDELRTAEAKLAQTKKDLPAKKQDLADKQTEVRDREQERADAVVKSMGEGVRQEALDRRVAVREAAPNLEAAQRAEIETVIRREIPRLFFKNRKFDKKELEKFRKELDRKGLDTIGAEFIVKVFYTGSVIKPEFAHLETTLGTMTSPDNLKDTASFVVTQILMLAQVAAPNILKTNLTAEETYLRSLQGDILPALLHEASKRTDLKDEIGRIRTEIGDGKTGFNLDMGKSGPIALIILGLLIFGPAAAGAIGAATLAGKLGLGVAAAGGIATAGGGAVGLRNSP
jgi:hypothetical protein